MNTKPKARKFRIKRTSPATAAAENAPAMPEMAEPAQTPAPDVARDFPPTHEPAPQETPVPETDTHSQAQDAPNSDAPADPEQDMDAIRREGLTGRQLRMARRVAQKHGLAPTSDFDAVRLLRAKGIDPFQRSNMLELVVPQTGDGGSADAVSFGGAPASPRVQLPQTMPATGVPQSGPELSPAERREQEISIIQRDIARRRRRKLGLLLVRLAFFVLLPTFVAGYYFYKIATPMYATTSQFLIIQSEGGGGTSPFGSILPTQFANSADSIATQAYLQSKDALLRLDADTGFKAHFASDTVDPLQRIEANATNEAAFKIFKKNVKIGYDPTEGVIRMEVIAADPQVSAQFSQKLLTYAEERVNNLSRQKREDGMRDARTGYETAQQKRRDAQEALITMQVENGVDPEAEIAAIRAQITQYEGLLIEKELELSALLDNARPNRAKVDGARGDVRRINVQLEKLHQKMNSATEGDNSLAKKAVTMQLAQADLAAADMVLQGAQTAMEQARTEANRQVRYLTIAVEPVAPDEPTYPRKFENTVLAFLVFAGLYLMFSLTASILREQVTA